MHFFDPKRPRLGNGLPAWLTAPDIALPHCVIYPLPAPSIFRLQFMINGSWKALITENLSEKLAEWVDSPENFSLSHFNCVPEKTKVFQFDAPTATAIDLDKLGI